mmetsp:Transcript_106243/g.310602  ORF Transcript_106243/g.310602 Transcript_106243/m.310602 type:complete len:250 (+) Transcript_106243:381-1130(+)
MKLSGDLSLRDAVQKQARHARGLAGLAALLRAHGRQPVAPRKVHQGAVPDAHIRVVQREPGPDHLPRPRAPEAVPRVRVQALLRAPLEEEAVGLQSPAADERLHVAAHARLLQQRRPGSHRGAGEVQVEPVPLPSQPPPLRERQLGEVQNGRVRILSRRGPLHLDGLPGRRQPDPVQQPPCRPQHAPPRTPEDALQEQHALLSEEPLRVRPQAGAVPPPPRAARQQGQQRGQQRRPHRGRAPGAGGRPT